VIVAYALGGGRGHVTRVRALLDARGDPGPVTILASGPEALDPRVRGRAEVVVVPPAVGRDRVGLGRFVTELLWARQPTELVLDAFPAGILGELGPDTVPADVVVTHTARHLRWRAYAAQLVTVGPSLDVVHVLEPLDPDHDRYLRDRGGIRAPLALGLAAGPPLGPDGTELTEGDLWRDAARHDADGRPVPLWLVVHGGPDGEVDELLAYARSEARHEQVEPRLVLVAPARDRAPADALSVPVLDACPAAPLLGWADRVFTGGGFNAVREASVSGVEHRVLPFPRRFDDQYRRAARARSASEAVVPPAP
jgi:hypothetical protein